MPEVIFLKLLNMSISASFLIAAVLLVRLLFRKAPRWIHCALWGLAALRLLIPFSIESPASLLPSGEAVPLEFLYTATPMMESGIPPIDGLINPVLTESLAPAPGDSANPTQILSAVLTAVWLVGAAVLLLYGVISYFLVRHKVRESVPLCGSIRLCDSIPSPFILGLLRPKIYLPSSVGEAEAQYIIAHENAHLARLDHLWKPLGFAVLILHWFNPLVWVGYVLLCRDIEMACDEKVIAKLQTEEKKAYSETLLACSVHRRLIAACPLAFGEVGVKERIKNVLNYKKPTLWIILLAVIAGTVTAVCFLTSPPTEIDDPLAVFLDCQIAERHQNEKSAKHFCALDFEILGKRMRGDTVTVYMWVLYEEFNWDDETDSVKLESGSHIPTVIQAKKDGQNYTLIEYRTPRDGAYHVADIRDMFPLSMQKEALDAEKYYEIQSPVLAAMAEEHYAKITHDQHTEENPPATSVKETDVAEIGGADGPIEIMQTRQMTLDDVIALAQKGNSLTWEDFSPFSQEFTEFWIPVSIRLFPISDSFRLYAGISPNFDLLFAFLHAPYYDKTADIRASDIGEFITAHKNPPAHVHTFSAIPYYTTHTAVATVSYANISDPPEKHLQYHELYRDCANCGYTEYLGWTYCNVDRGKSDTDCARDCLNTNRFDHVASRLAIEYRENEIRCLIDFIEEAGFEDARTCIEHCPNIYNTMLTYSDLTLRYVFKCFIAGGQTGLRGDILRALLDDLVPEYAIRYGSVPETAQMYFSEWERTAKNLQERYGNAWMEENDPAGALLLRMLNMR